MQRVSLVAGIVWFLCLPSLAFSFQGPLQFHPKRPSQPETFWRPPPSQAGQPQSLLGALAQYGRNSEDDRLLRSRGYVRSFYFDYKGFKYERDFFNVYKGVTLRQFFDGKFDLGLYKHQFNQGHLFGPAGAPPPARNRLELMLRWNPGK